MTNDELEAVRAIATCPFCGADVEPLDGIIHLGEQRLGLISVPLAQPHVADSHLRFLQLKEQATGLRFDQPVLD